MWWKNRWWMVVINIKKKKLIFAGLINMAVVAC
jgi:hypothetical protein